MLTNPALILKILLSKYPNEGFLVLYLKILFLFQISGVWK